MMKVLEQEFGLVPQLIDVSPLPVASPYGDAWSVHFIGTMLTLWAIPQYYVGEQDKYRPALVHTIPEEGYERFVFSAAELAALLLLEGQ